MLKLAISWLPAPRGRWGSVLGVQPDGLEFETAEGKAFRFPLWAFNRLLLPLFVNWGYYRGVRTNAPLVIRGLPTESV